MVGVAVSQESALDSVALIRLHRISSRTDLVRNIESINIQKLRQSPQMVPFESIQRQLNQQKRSSYLQPLHMRGTGLAHSVDHPSSRFIGSIVIKILSELETAGDEHLGQINHDGGIGVVLALRYEPLTMDGGGKSRREIRSADVSDLFGERGSARGTVYGWLHPCEAEDRRQWYDETHFIRGWFTLHVNGGGFSYTSFQCTRIPSENLKK